MRTPLEQVWYDFLIENNIEFKEHFHIGRYELDFLIGIVDLEIDGLQHKNRVQKDRKRDSDLELMGLKVVRIQMNYHRFFRKKQQKRLEEYKAQVLEILREYGIAD